VLLCPACGSGWVVVGLPYRGTLSCVSCHNQWARPSAALHTPEGEWYDRHLSTPRQPKASVGGASTVNGTASSTQAR
jgi:hypothetical protein